MKKLFLLDAMALIYRAYFALNKNPRINSKGVNTSAMLGFTNTLWELIKKEQPTHIAVAFDSREPTFRHVEYPLYKAQRDDIPEDIALAIPIVKEIINGFNIPILAMSGFEADDIVGTLAKQAEKEGFQTYMMTMDKDYGQLVSENIFLYKPARMGNGVEVMGVEEVCKKHKIKYPEQLIDILGLWGDASDNIPGVPGIGEKNAAKLLEKYESIENLLEHTHELKGKQKENLENFREQALLSKRLATILLDVPVTFDAAAYEMKAPNEQALRKIFDELEFRTLAQRIFTDLSLSAPATTNGQMDLFGGDEQHGGASVYASLETTEHQYHIVKEHDDLVALADTLQKAGNFCFDTETTSLQAANSELVGLSFSIKKGEAWYVPVPPNREECMRMLGYFKTLFEDPAVEKTGQNLKYDNTVLLQYDVKVCGRMFDTMLAHYLIEPEMKHNMDFLAMKYLGYQPVPIEELIGKKGVNQRSMRSVDVEKVAPYACEDADITLQLRQVFEPLLEQQGLLELFWDVEMPLMPVLASMEAEGVALNTAALEAYSYHLALEIKSLEEDIHTLAGETFNIGSPKQLGEVLFAKMKIVDKPKRTKTKQFSTSEDVLSKLVDKHPIIGKILEYRSISKLKSTYVDALPALISPRTGRIHTSYNQAVTATGRLSSNNPNLQNIPIRTERGREIRKAFVPRSDEYILMASDYSQIELRIIASLSGDEAMMAAFQSGRDVHTDTASRVYGVPFEEVTKDMRRHAKTVNFGIIYGISAFGLSERMQISRGEAKNIIEEYFRQYPGIKKYMDDVIEHAHEQGYVETLLKRRRYLRDIQSQNRTVREFAERNAINAPIQGSSADMIKLAMIRIHEAMQTRNMKSKMILQVHDELVFDVYKPELDELSQLVEQLMLEALPLNVPLAVDLNTGTNWLEAH